MPLFNVHLYREMRLFFPGIEATTPGEAAALAADRLPDDAVYAEDCNGENLAALVDVVGDDAFEHSITIDFEPERLRQAASDMQEALQDCIRQIHTLLPSSHQSDSTLDNLPAVRKARSAIAKATANPEAALSRSQP